MPSPKTPRKKPGISGLLGRQIVTVPLCFLPHFPHAFPALFPVSLRLTAGGTVGLPPLRVKGFPADGTGAKLRGNAFCGKCCLQCRVQRKNCFFKIPAVSPRPAFRQHIAGGVKGKAQPGFLVIVGTHSRNKRADFFLLVTGQLPGGHLGLRATLARSAGFYDQSPEPFAALAFLSPALLIITASPAWIVIVPAWMRGFFHHSFKGAGGKIHLVSSSFSSSISSSSHGGVSISSASSSVSSVNSSGSSYSQ